MTNVCMVQGRRNTLLAGVIGSVLAAYAGGASALEFEFDNGVRINWNTTLSVGSSWRAENPHPYLYTRADGSLIGLWSGQPLYPGQYPKPGDGLAGNQAAGDGNLNWGKNDRFSTPFKLITDVEVKKGNFGGLVRVKAWYDQALNDENVRVGNQANNFNGVRPGLGPVPGYGPCTGNLKPPACIPLSPPGQNLWPSATLSDEGFEDEQKFDNVYLLDAYLYGSFAIGGTDLQVRLGNQVVNWGESVFIQGVNQINPIDVPAARRAGAELKEILLPVWLAYANWGFSFGSVEAFYQLKWNNTSVDGCGQYFTQSGTQISADPGRCRSITVLGVVNGAALPGTAGPLIPQLGSSPFLQASGTYIGADDGIEPSDSGQFGLAFRFPVDKIDTEIGLYAMNIHSRLPISSSRVGTTPADLQRSNPTAYGALAAAGLVGTDAWGGYWKSSPTSTTLVRSLFPQIEKGLEGLLASNGLNVDLKPGTGFWEYPEDIQVYGISAATNLFGWSTSAEFSYTTDAPVQVNGNDLLQAGLAGIGPYRQAASEASAKGIGTHLPGYGRFDKRQFQVNAVKTLSNVLWADNMLVVGEIGMQWNNIPDYTKGGIRYGRGFMYGYGSGPEYAPGGFPQGQPTIPFVNGDWCSPTLVGAPVPLANPSFNPHPLGCKNDGYITDHAWGYRLRVSADYLNVFNSGITVTPSVFWSHDVEGISMDPAFIEDRQVLGLGLKFTYNKQYTLALDWVDYADENFDPLFDRDYYSASVSVTF